MTTKNATEYEWTRPTDRALPQASQLLDVDIESGICRWKIDGRGKRVGATAGAVERRGYTRIEIDGVKVYAHRLVMFAATGTPPPSQIDHVKRDKDARGALFNGISNLRDGGDGTNQANKFPNSNNSSGWPGVIRKRGKHQVRIKRDGRTVVLGTYASPLIAWVRYVGAKFADHPTSARCDLPNRVEAARDADE
jgi:hypothetical protein